MALMPKNETHNVLLNVKDLSVTFKTPSGDFEAVKDASFSIQKGKTLALVGESGSGKSVSALSIMQLLPYPMAFHSNKSSIQFENKELIGIKESDIRAIRGKRIGMIFQEPLTSLNPLHTIERQIGEVLFLHQNMGKKAVKARVKELLDLVGLPMLQDRLNAYPHELSGGQRQRVMIAMALANEPDLLIADEPTTALDVTIQAQILELLKSLQQKMGMALLLITHDLKVVEKMADDVCVMKNGEIVEHKDTKTLFAKPEHDYTKMLLAAQPKGKPPEIKEDKSTHLLSASDIRIHFPKKKTLLGRTTEWVKAVDGINLHVNKGETIGIVGESGSGKTTLGLGLMRMIGAQGKIIFDGQEISARKRKHLKALRAHMQIVFQDPFGSLSPRMTVGQIIGEGLSIHKKDISKSEREALVIQALKDVHLDPGTRHRYPHEFSGGQRQRISIARAMVLQPEFVMLDEPTSALDVSVQAQIVDLLRELQEKHHLTYMFISHDLRVVRAMSHYLLVMKDGVIVEHGPAQEIFDHPKEDYTKALMEAAIHLRTNTKTA